MIEICRLLPESVVWLYANGRVAEAEQIIRNAAKLNNITVPDKILVRPEIDVTVDSNVDGEKSDYDTNRKSRAFLNSFHHVGNSFENTFRRSRKTKDESTRYTILDIFRNRRLTINLFCLSFMWLVKSAIITSNVSAHNPHVRRPTGLNIQKYITTVREPSNNTRTINYDSIIDRTRVVGFIYYILLF